MRDYDDVLAETRDATRPSAEQLARVEAELTRRQGRKPPRARWIAGAGVALALAAAALFTLRAPADVARPLDHSGAVALGDKVQVDADGEGAVVGSAREMTLDWRRGKLSVEVEPKQGVQLAVRTDEGTVRVVGTGFDVDRGPLGTTVTVRHGKVSVDCVRGGLSYLTVGESRTCEPVSAAGALRRTLALQGVVSPEALLVEVNGALGRTDADGAVAAELLALRAGTLLEAGRDADALAAAERALAAPDVTRAEELHRMAARLRLASGDCAGALPHLQALDALGRLGEEEPALRRCDTPAP